MGFLLKMMGSTSCFIYFASPYICSARCRAIPVVKKIIKLCLTWFYSAESWIFKSKFSGWDDVLQVDFTRTAETVAQRRRLPVGQVKITASFSSHRAQSQA